MYRGIPALLEIDAIVALPGSCDTRRCHLGKKKWDNL